MRCAPTCGIGWVSTRPGALRLNDWLAAEAGIQVQPVPEIVLLLAAALRYAPVIAVPLAYVSGLRVWVTPPDVAVPHVVNGTAAVFAKKRVAPFAPVQITADGSHSLEL